MTAGLGHTHGEVFCALVAARQRPTPQHTTTVDRCRDQRPANGSRGGVCWCWCWCWCCCWRGWKRRKRRWGGSGGKSADGRVGREVDSGVGVQYAPHHPLLGDRAPPRPRRCPPWKNTKPCKKLKSAGEMLGDDCTTTPLLCRRVGSMTTLASMALVTTHTASRLRQQSAAGWFRLHKGCVAGQVGFRSTSAHERVRPWHVLQY